MPKLKPATQRARREHILDAAEVCFARSGFHRTTMQDICKEAAVSPGALYVYFASKEDLIAGLAERDRSSFAERFADVSDEPDFMQALAKLGHQYLVEEPPHRRTLCLEIGLESTRNPKVGEIYRSVDRFVEDSFRKLFTELAAEGRITPDVDIETLTKMFSVIGDGMFTRRALDPGFDAGKLVPAMMGLIGKMLNAPAAGEPTASAPAKTAERRK